MFFIQTYGNYISINTYTNLVSYIYIFFYMFIDAARWQALQTLINEEGTDADKAVLAAWLNRHTATSSKKKY